MDIKERLEKIENLSKELDSLIEDTLNNEPTSEIGNYGEMIAAVFKDLAWIDVCVG